MSSNVSRFSPPQDLPQEHAQRNVEVQASNDEEFGTYVVIAEQNEVPWYNKSKAKHSSQTGEAYLPPTKFGG
ncbi:MAG: hypothetical protein ABGX16_16495 [Pirellulales bacterium]